MTLCFNKQYTIIMIRLFKLDQIFRLQSITYYHNYTWTLGETFLKISGDYWTPLLPHIQRHAYFNATHIKDARIYQFLVYMVKGISFKKTPGC